MRSRCPRINGLIGALVNVRSNGPLDGRPALGFFFSYLTGVEQSEMRDNPRYSIGFHHHHHLALAFGKRRSCGTGWCRQSGKGPAIISRSLCSQTSDSTSNLNADCLTGDPLCTQIVRPLRNLCSLFSRWARCSTAIEPGAANGSPIRPHQHPARSNKFLIHWHALLSKVRDQSCGADSQRCPSTPLQRRDSDKITWPADRSTTFQWRIGST